MPKMSLKRTDEMTESLTPFEQRAGDETQNGLHLGGLLWRHRWLILVSILVFVGGGLLYVRVATPLYEASASLRIEAKEPNREEIWAITQGTTVSTDLEVLGSRSLVEDAARALSLQVRLVEPRRVSRSAVLEVLEVAPDAQAGDYRLSRQADGSFALRMPRPIACSGTPVPATRSRSPVPPFDSPAPRPAARRFVSRSSHSQTR